MITVFLTAFYMFRAIYMTFHGEYRGGDPGGDFKHTHESPVVMVWPLVFLAILAVIAGWWNLTGGFNELFGHHAGHAAHSFFGGLFGAFTHTVNGVPLPVIALVIGLFGIFMAWVIYNKRWISPESMGKVFGPFYTLVYRKYFFDEFYENVMVKLVAMKGLFTGFTIFDSKGVDGVVNGVGAGITGSGRGLRRAQTGQLQLYALFIGIGVVLIALAVYLFG
jgi:NADH-quinone oxidoreductase subunit L